MSPILLTFENASYLVGIVLSLLLVSLPWFKLWYASLSAYPNGWLVKRAVFAVLLLTVSAGIYVYEWRSLGAQPSLAAYWQMVFQVFIASQVTFKFVTEKLAEKLTLKREG